MRWILLDSFNFIDIKNGCTQAVRAITKAEDFFDDAFSFSPSLPQTLQIEMIAQAGGVLAGATLDFQKEIILGKIDLARFYEEVYPPSLLTIDARIVERWDEGSRIEGKITNQGQSVCEVTLLLIHMDRLLLDGMPPDGKSVVFSDLFMNTYRIKEMLGRTRS